MYLLAVVVFWMFCFLFFALQRLFKLRMCFTLEIKNLVALLH